MNTHSGTSRFNYSRIAKLLALAPICASLAGCPPLIMPNVTTQKYDNTFSFPADPQPWLTLENDDINFYIYQGCDSYSDGCDRQYLIPLKRGTPPDWKNLLDGHPITWFIQGVNVPLRRPLSAYVPGTHYRLLGSFGHHPEIVLANPQDLFSDKHPGYPAQGVLRLAIEDFNELVYPGDIDVQLVIYEDDHQWVFTNPPKFKPRTGDHPKDLFVPGKLFHFEAGDDARLNQPMALYYTGRGQGSIGRRVVSGDAAQWWSKKNRVNPVSLADVEFPSVPLKLDTLTLDGKTMSGQPTLRCYYSHTQFNLGWLDSGPRGGPSEAYRTRCDPYPGQARAE
ncbi:hypothetical protein BLA39750_05573 [Burkholderia lata]|uniref:Lipoprotein n=1 Tax=Burkholderia lata (strain ATCC 17760 / DSM 23089 / LMG 22485 / NCIMB 9086 / R18194 / 383) TaxID=482957 RepID=A0A6P3AIX6_BURL3|nr:hypothetical protein BLA39750_05573 [Burkholderia lata]